MDNVLSAIGAELASDFSSAEQVVRVILRTLAALLLGGMVGWQREHMGKAAGLRTHMLVSLGAAVAMLVGQLGDMPLADQSRIIQGILTGIGFIGGGAILKLSEQAEIKGLTTAASIWLTAAVGIAAGAGRLGLAVFSTLMALLVLSVLGRWERRLVPEGGRENA
jgi:putative Mg2+ transporter-C (MgtC) family protein